jgi:hypothetical protein
VAIDAQPGEGVVSRRGMRELGADGLERLNRGQAPGGAVSVALHLDGRQIASALVDPLGGLVGGRPLGRRSSVG